MAGRTKTVMPLVLAFGGTAFCAALLLAIWGGTSRSPAPMAMKLEACTALAIDRATGVTREVPCAQPSAPLLVAGKAQR